jgi:signal transduction histidine kinase
MRSLAAGFAFFACGAVFFSTATLLLFSPRSRGVRWFALSQCPTMAWLAMQGWWLGGGDAPRGLFYGTIHMIPAFFLAFALAQGGGWPDWKAALAIPAGALFLPWATALAGDGGRSAGVGAVQALMWTAGVTALVRGARGSPREHPGSPKLAVWVVSGLVVVLPLGFVGGYVTNGRSSLYFLPLAMVWIQFLVWVGVARLRFYDIEVRAARSGELAAGAAEQERLAVLGELSASVAHEVRNPLTGMRSLAQRLAEDEIDDARRRRYAAVILEEAERVERIVANLLGVARRAAVRPDPAAETPLGPLFDDLLLLVEVHARKAGVAVSADGAGAVARAPREALAQATLNLLLNAIRHTPPGGTVRLRARPADGGVEVSVRDTGPGVPPAECERIWTPFHSEGGGTGLGLAVVRRIARDLAWEARVDDAPGGGAEFTLRIPGAAR